MRALNRCVGLCGVAMAVATTAVSAQPPGPSDAPRPTDFRVPAGAPRHEDPAAAERLDQVLARWERSWASTHSIEVRFVLVKRFLTWESEQRFEGSALVSLPDKLKVTLEIVEPDPVGGRSRRRFHHQIVGSGRTMVLLSNDLKQAIIHPWGASGQQTLLNDELLMLLFGMKADDMKGRFHITLMKQTPQADYLQFVPKTTGSFSRLDLVLDRKTSLPSYFRLLDSNGKDTQTYTFTKARRDPEGVTDSDFQTAIPKGWNVVDLRLPEPPPNPPLPVGGRHPPPIISEPATVAPRDARASAAPARDR
jgi:outer membrane lipoprotein-sorting protein